VAGNSVRATARASTDRASRRSSFRLLVKLGTLPVVLSLVVSSHIWDL
jgi:hypothetical protein